MRGARWILAAVLALGASTAGCMAGDDDGPPASSAAADLPPSGTAEMAAAWNDELAPLGWKVQRSSLEEEHFDPTVSVPPGRRHLALYLRPTREPTNQDYLDGLAETTRLFVPKLFDDFAGLASFDVCLEPTEARDPSPYPKALTQVLVVRRQAGQFDWAGATAADVAAAATRQPPVFALHVDDALRQTPEWAAIDPAPPPGG